MRTTKRIGVLLMTFGTPSGPDDITRYLTSVRGGRAPDAVTVAEFERRYRLIGGSPLLAHTKEQAVALGYRLAMRDPAREYHVAVGLRHSAPTIADGLAELVGKDISHVVGVVLSPQYSPTLMGGYGTAFEAALSAFPQVDGYVVGPWHLNAHFIMALAGRIREALGRFPDQEREQVPVILTAHSLPKAVAEREPEYLQQLHETADAVAAVVPLEDGRWQFAYQSSGHTPVPWLQPDLKALFPQLRDMGFRTVLVVPVQFLADHLEVLYDIDIAARAEAEALGLRLERIESLHTSPFLIEALADLVLQSIVQEQTV